MALTASDYEEIRQLLARYCHTLDFEDLDGFVECFTPDASFEGNSDQDGLAGKHEGHEELRALAQTVAEFQEGHGRHSALNVLIEGDGDAASALSYCLVTRDYGMPFGRNQTPHAQITTSGIYDDELRKVDGRWYISARKFRFDGTPDVMARLGKPVVVGRAVVS